MCRTNLLNSGETPGNSSEEEKKAEPDYVQVGVEGDDPYKYVVYETAD